MNPASLPEWVRCFAGFFGRSQEIFLPGQRLVSSTHGAHTPTLREKSTPCVLQQVQAAGAGMEHFWWTVGPLKGDVNVG